MGVTDQAVALWERKGRLGNSDGGLTYPTARCRRPSVFT